jgi:hypothetical protein
LQEEEEAKQKSFNHFSAEQCSILDDHSNCFGGTVATHTVHADPEFFDVHEYPN